MTATTLPIVPTRARLTGTERTRVAKKLAAAYRRGATVRDLAEQTGRSYGATHRLLNEAGVQLRGRGGKREAAK